MTNKALENPQSNGHERSKTSTFIMMFLATILIMNTISSEQYLTAQQAFQHTSTVWSLSSKTLVTLKNDGVNLVPPVEQLAKSHIQDGIKCPYPLIPIYNKVIPQSSNNNQRIPRAFHFAWLKGYYAHDGTSRCISPDMMDVIQKWIEHFPSYNIHFHDDESVDDLLTQEWPEFPSLAKIIQSCAMYGNAMTIDIWRQLILFRYGGVYVDLDMLPGPEFTEASIFPDDSAVFLSDTLNRPSQWCMAMEQRSPIAYFTLLEILKNIQEMKDVSDPKLVWTTGPAALEAGYKKVIGNAEDASTVLLPGVHNSSLTSGPIRKWVGNEDYILSLQRQGKVPFPRNHTSTGKYALVNKKERMHKEMNGIHWQTLIQRTKNTKSQERCIDLMYKHDMNATQIASDAMALNGNKIL